MANDPKKKNPYKKNPLFANYFFLSDTNKATSAQLAQRSIYSVKLNNGQVGKIPANYEKSFTNVRYKPLTSWAIVDIDYNLQGDVQNWFKTNKEVPTEAKYNFVAQTIVSASYGLLQMMYPTAAMDMGFQSNGVGLDPIGLSRPKIILNLGAGFLAKKFKDVNNSVKNDVSQFATYAAYTAALKWAFAGYNGGGNYQQSDPQIYGKKVLSQSDKYQITTPFATIGE